MDLRVQGIRKLRVLREPNRADQYSSDQKHLNKPRIQLDFSINVKKKTNKYKHDN